MIVVETEVKESSPDVLYEMSVYETFFLYQ